MKPILNAIFINSQQLKYKVIKLIDNYHYDIQFEIDNLILYNKFHNDIKNGNILHPNNTKYKISKNGIFYEDVLKITQKYNNKYDLQLNNIELYYLIGINKWFDDSCKHMEFKNIKYDKIKAHNIALKFKKLSDFTKYAYNCYSISHKNNWLDDICSHMIRSYKVWTKELCQKEALKYINRKEFYNTNVNCYSICVKNNWLDDICSHMEWNGGKKWTKQECINLALNYNNVGDFLKFQRNCYQFSRKYGWLKEITLHMKPKNQLKFPRFIYAWKFKDNHIYIGLTKNKYIREKLRLKDNNDPINLHISKTLLIPKYIRLTEFIPAEEAQIKEIEFIENYTNNGWILLNRNKGGSLGGCLTDNFIKRI